MSGYYSGRWRLRGAALVVGLVLPFLQSAPMRAQEVLSLATDGGSLQDESFATRATFMAVHGDRAAEQWVKEHNAELAIGAPAKPHRVAWFSSGALELAEPGREAFLQGLREIGYRLGRDLVMDWHFAEGKVNELPAMAASIVGSTPDVIVLSATPEALATKQLTSSIPLVVQSVDPIGAGLVSNLERPGGNVTGMQFYRSASMARTSSC